MNSFMNWLFWPLLLYMLILSVLAEDNIAGKVDAVLIAGCLAMACAVCLGLFVALPRYGYEWRKNWNPRLWPQPLRRSLSQVILALAGIMILCIIGVYVI